MSTTKTLHLAKDVIGAGILPTEVQWIGQNLHVDWQREDHVWATLRVGEDGVAFRVATGPDFEQCDYRPLTGVQETLDRAQETLGEWELPAVVSWEGEQLFLQWTATGRRAYIEIDEENVCVGVGLGADQVIADYEAVA